MKNIFDIIFILIILYIIYKLFFNFSNEYFEDISGFTIPSPTPSQTINTIITPGPSPTPSIVNPSPAPGPSPIIIDGINFTDYTKKYYSLFAPSPAAYSGLSPNPSFGLLNIPAPISSQTDVSINYIKYLTPEQEARISVGTIKYQTEFSKIYSIGSNFDALYDNYNNLISNSSIQLLNEVLTNTKFKANQNSMIINFNSGLKAVTSLYIKQDDVIDYAKYFVTIMNSIGTVGNSFTFVKVNPVSKEQFENQLRVNFTIEIKYKYPKANNGSLEIAPSDFTLVINVIMLFEKEYTNSNTRSYLETFAIIGVSNFEYLSGYTKNKK